MKFIRRKNIADYTEDATFDVNIAGTDYPVTIEGLGAAADTALEVELDDGTVVILLGYIRK
jgi:hypothetical protein